MNNPRGPMTPFEKRAAYDRANVFYNLSFSARNVADQVRLTDNRDMLEQLVVELERLIELSQITIKEMKDASPT